MPLKGQKLAAPHTRRERSRDIARNRYEAFAHPSIDLTMCVVNLQDYTRPVRATILYNHIYFSDRPKEYKLALLEERGYEKILVHHNYNPRVIEYMTQLRHAKAVPPTIYLREFIDSLDNPSRLWDHAFRHQISEAARHLLLVLTTLPDETKLENLEKAFWKFSSFSQKRFGFAAAPGDWLDALKELDGNFIKTAKVGGDIAISFHNPSVKDFMEQFLADSDADVIDLFRGAQFYEQYAALWAGRRGRRYQGIDRASGEYLRVLAADLWGESARTMRNVDQQGETVGLRSYPPSKESRAAFFIRIVEDLNSAQAAQMIDSVVDSLSALWNGGSGEPRRFGHIGANSGRRRRSPRAAFQTAVARNPWNHYNPRQVDFELVGDLTEIGTIAAGRGIRDLARLRSLYGKGYWRKMKGSARIRLRNGRIRLAEIHRYEAHGIGKKEFKRKRYLD